MRNKAVAAGARVGVGPAMPNRYAPMGRLKLPGTASGTPPRPPKAAKVVTVPKAMAPAKAARRNMVDNLGTFAHPRKGR